MDLSSPAFRDGGPIPPEYGYTEANVNPPLEIADTPAAAESLVLVVDDPDALEPAGKVWRHWLVWNVNPTRKRIPEDWATGTATAVEGENDYGEVGYGGPNPPDGEHTYRFRLFALDTTLDLDAGATLDDLERVMEGHVLEEASYEGTYAP
ncbi:YbhB/YbcL family Raf kinase inhibitor-like protein [Haloplanus rallus]|jgi:Raf kinase inhibitor-like YbhB/YbcL family protein|uniref:YbhB/YbcL family Raf kinase inhibitor-like protein n=1 Tax=Haloplanus rallus TaxID=1816183 RepID=A0A6B9FGA4_9EURY|nr:MULTISPECIES: YbhB/YbcL family Raf kinase inhibitor-like protein [Haloplanus]QGX95133.1 YbhB/YbcL family Raf kinase inhibitor-like protein [Haloplanus rallus]